MGMKNYITITKLKVKAKRGVPELKELKSKVKKGVTLIGEHMSMDQHEPNNS